MKIYCNVLKLNVHSGRAWGRAQPGARATVGRGLAPGEESLVAARIIGPNLKTFFASVINFKTRQISRATNTQTSSEVFRNVFFNDGHEKLPII